jgi:hypothetical protein
LCTATSATTLILGSPGATKYTASAAACAAEESQTTPELLDSVAPWNSSATLTFLWSRNAPFDPSLAAVLRA